MKAKSKKMPVAPKLTPEEIAINAAWRARDLKADVPTLARCILFDLLHPEQNKFPTLPRRKRERILAQTPGHWTSKLTLKLDRLVFPELMAGEKKLTEGKKLGRLVGYHQTATGLASKERTKKLGHLVSGFGFRSQLGKDSPRRCERAGDCKSIR